MFTSFPLGYIKTIYGFSPVDAGARTAGFALAAVLARPVGGALSTWETQETDYPSVGPDRPEYEPRGCPRGAAFSWYTYSPTRVRHPTCGGAPRCT